MSDSETPTAVVVTDPQNDFLEPDGVTWGVVGVGRHCGAGEKARGPSTI